MLKNMNDTGRAKETGKHRFIRIYDLIIENLVSILILTSLFSVTYGILSRNFTFLPFFIWTEELARYSMITMVFVIAGLSVRKGVHLGLDILLEKLPQFWNRILTTIINFIVIIFLAYLAFIFFSYAPVAIQTSPALGVPRTYLYIIMGVGFVLMIMELLVLSIRQWKREEV